MKNINYFVCMSLSCLFHNRIAIANTTKLESDDDDDRDIDWTYALKGRLLNVLILYINDTLGLFTKE